jgi:Glycosyltransferase family 87
VSLRSPTASLSNEKPFPVRTGAIVVASLALLVYLLSGPLRAPGAFVRGNAIDFNAAYCGTKVAEQGADPYRVEPLRQCEHAATPTKDDTNAWIVVPAPLPGYTFLLLRPLVHVPYDAAKTVWVLLGIASLLIASFCAARVTALPWVAVLLAFTPAVGLLNMWYGEPVPLAIALIGGAALAAHRGRDELAGVLAGLSLLEPHVGLGACVGAFVALPRARLPLLATGVVLGGLSLATVGLQRDLEYLRIALPAQARSEINVNYQLSLAHLLSLTGVPTRLAVTLGSLSYAVMTLAGAVFARRLVRGGVRAAAVYVPVTCAMLGGPYVHTVEIAAAIPGVLLLCTVLEGGARVLGALALALLIVPWNPGANGEVANVPLTLAAVFVACALVLDRTGAPLRIAAGITLALGIYIAAIPPGTPQTPPQIARPGAIRADDLASRGWTMFVSSSRIWPHEDAQHLMLKVPQWLGLLLALAAALRVQTASAPEARVEQSAKPSLRFLVVDTEDGRQA